MSDCTASSVNLRPIRRLASNTVFTGFIATWFFAASPISRSVSVKPTSIPMALAFWDMAAVCDGELNRCCSVNGSEANGPIYMVPGEDTHRKHTYFASLRNQCAP
uniref:Secreted protein n=1 Tax=Steinernema glaseri TaxID=37863 RepID=A0A1I8ASP3_9BILA